MNGWIFVTTAHHAHAQNIAGSLLDHGVLDQWWGGLVFAKDSPAAHFVPWKKRILADIPAQRLHALRRWEALRVLAARAGVRPSLQDRIWEHGEFSLDALAAAHLDPGLKGAIGFEHGCLATLRRARELGQRGVVVFASAHHSFRERVVDPEYARHPDWCDPDERLLLARAAERDRRRDEEIAAADTIVANSPFTAHTLIGGGAPAERIVTVPLGFPEVPPPARGGEGGSRGNGPLRLVYAGAVGLHKGFHHLQAAFTTLPQHTVHLDVFGALRVHPDALARQPNLVFHGPVSRERLARAFAGADAMVFPTLCDGFGMAGAEAMAHGLPLLCSRSAGVSAFVRDGVNGLLLDPADPSALAALLRRCLDERPSLAAMREPARQAAADWGWHHFRASWFESICHRA